MISTSSANQAPRRLAVELRSRAGALTEWLPGYLGEIEKVGGTVEAEPAISGTDGDRWTAILAFPTPDALRAWRESPARKERLDAIRSNLLPDGLNEVSLPGPHPHEEPSVTEVILDRVQSGREEAYREWSDRVQHAQATFPGYLGGYTQRTSDDGLGWMTLMRYRTPEDLGHWMRSPERAALLAEGRDLVAESYQHQVDASFPGWVPANPDTGEAPSNLKTTMLVLLGLYPIVALEITYLMKTMAGLPNAVSGFIGNAISCSLTGYVTMPLFVRWMGWWLFPKGADRSRANLRGTLLLLLLYAIEIALFWKIL